MSTEPSPAAGITPEPTTLETDNDSSAGPKLSKSAQKRQAKAERLAKLKLERRAKEKQQKAAKRKEREERAAAGEELGPSDAKKRRVLREGEGPVQPFNARVVIDLGFDEMMSEKEIGSLCSQLSYTYASHRRTRTPFTSLLFTSLNGRSRELLDKTNDSSYRRWRSTEWWEEDINGLWDPQPHSEGSGEQQLAQVVGADEMAGPTEIVEVEAETSTLREPQEPESIELVPSADEPTTQVVNAPSARLKNRRARKPEAPQPRSSCTQESVVYLTADAEDELTELKEGETYVIGGIVDRNRYKNLCQEKAKRLNIRSARLPIGRYLADMPTRKVLTVNQVFDILVYWVNTRDWEQAMQKVMPKRKFNANGKKGKRTQGEARSGGENTDDGGGSEPEESVQPADDV